MAAKKGKKATGSRQAAGVGKPLTAGSLRTVKRDWCQKNSTRLTQDTNLLGVGVGPKEKDGVVVPDQMAVKFFVRTKRKVVAPEEMLPASRPGMPTDVVEMAPLRARGSFTQRVRPGVGGCSGCVVVPNLTYTGTLGLGMRGFGGLAGKVFVLSNNHVLADENRARVGDPVIQPGSLDGGSAPSDVIGHLYDYVPLQFASFTDPNPPRNKVDAACAKITRFGDFTREIFWVGYPKGWKARQDVETAVTNGDTGVEKTGRTTGFTTGSIAAVGFDGWVGYDSGDAYFEDQMLITPGDFSDAGDSGSCILDSQENIVGLLFAGGATHTIANYIEDVWSMLGPIDFSDPLMRIATFNVENLDDKPGQEPSLQSRIAIMRGQLERLRADVLCLQEVHGQETQGQPRSLLALEALLHGTEYAGFHVAHTRTTNGEAYDERNLVVVSRFPVLDTQQLKHDLTPQPQYRMVTSIPQDQNARDISWERPIFYVTLDLGQGRTLHVIVLHLKSKIPSNVPGQKIDRFTWRTVSGWAEGYFLASMRRVGQALETRRLIDQIFDGEPEAWIVACGDLNADTDSVPVNAIRGPVEETGNPDLGPRIMVPCEQTVPDSSRYSLVHLGSGEMLDHILVSRPLLARYRGTEIHNEVLPDESGAFRTDVKFPESDHAPVIAEFGLT